jgi:iron-sulfur cluster repair protein YtfE (RIC family)
MSKTVVKICRENWDNHPKYHSSGASFLTHIHQSFREDCLRIEKFITKKQIRQAGHLFDELENTLHHHHTIEERTIFPFLKKHMNQGTDSEKLTGDHKEMTKNLEKLEQIFAKYEESRYDDLQDAFQVFRTHLIEHLNEEEDICIPVLVEHPINKMW